MDDGRHKISDKMLNNLKTVAYAQDDFGMGKYKEPLNPNYKYDWLHMLLEELADALKYVQCEIERREAVKGLLKSGIALKDWTYIELAINELEKTGTGKELKNP